MRGHSEDLPTLFVALRDRPPLPPLKTAADERSSKSAVAKPRHSRRTTTESARRVHASRKLRFRKREWFALAAVCLLAWPDAVQMQSHSETAQARANDSELRVARVDPSEKPRSLKWDLAGASRD